MKTPEFMIRVKLPSSGAYHSSPSGDTEFEDAYRKAIFAVLPEGFEVNWPLLNHRTPHDSEGFTWIRLSYTGNAVENPQAYWIAKCQEAQAELRRLKEAISKLA